MATQQTPPQSCLARLSGMYEQLPDAERRAADVIARRAEEVVVSSITDVATWASVAPSTVSRLCGRLGYSGFPAMKIALAVELFNADDSAAAPVHASDESDSVITKVIATSVQGLLSTAETLDAGALALAADRLVACRAADLYARGELTGSIARMARSRLLVAGVRASHCHDPELMSTSAALLGPGDVAIGFSKSGTRESTISALRTAGHAGATTIAITAGRDSELAAIAEIALIAAARETWSWGHQAATMLPILAVVEALYAQVLLTKYQQDSRTGGD